MAEYWGRRVDVLTRGFSGYNTRTARRIVKTAVPQALMSSFVTIFFGANDSCMEGTPQVCRLLCMLPHAALPT